MKKRIVVTVSGGVVQFVEIPEDLPDVIVEVHDYDNGGCSVPTDKGIEKDVNGDLYSLDIWRGAK